MPHPGFLLSYVFLSGLMLRLADSHGLMDKPQQWPDGSGEWLGCLDDASPQDWVFYCAQVNYEAEICQALPDMTAEELHEWLNIPSKEAYSHLTWFANYTFIPGDKTLDPSMRT